MYSVNIWWHFLQFFVFMCFVGTLTFKVFEKHLRVRKEFFGIMVIIYTTIVSGIIALTLTEISPYKSFLPIGINTIIVFSIITFKFLIKKNTFSLLFVFFVFLNLQYNSFLLAKATICYNVIPQLTSYEYGNLLLLSIFYGAIMFPIIYYILVKLYKPIIDEDITSNRMKFFFCLPAGFYFSVSLLIKMNYGIPTKGMFLPLIVINICTLGAYFAALDSITASHEASSESEKLYAANIQLALWQKQYENLETQIASEARIRHDWKHHIVTVLGFVEKNDMIGLSEYLADYKEKYVIPEATPICDVSALNMMFQYYKRKAADLKINMSITPVSFNKCDIPVSVLTVVFGNLLENAIEACERQVEAEIETGKYITLRIQHNENNLIVILCENSFDGIVNKSDNKIKSRKKIGGIGLSSIENIAQKYNGSMKIKIEDKKFKVYVALS